MVDFKQNTIEIYFRAIMEELGINLNDPSVKDTPARVAKMFIQELFSGLDPSKEPKISAQPNEFNYDQMLIESNIMINSVCEHHFVPIIGYCHIAYIPKNKLVGLSKLNRIAQYLASKPQVQERLTNEIFEKIKLITETNDVAVTVDAIHMCVRMRGVKDYNSKTRTTALGGSFLESARNEFLNAIPRLSDLRI